jgi:hypothetical protein
MERKLSILNLSLVATYLILNLACGFLNRSENNSSNLSANNANSNQKSEQQVSAPKDLKAPEPCGWLEKSLSLNLKTEPYKESSYTPGRYDCDQAIVLVNRSQFNYTATGDATTVKQLYISVSIKPENTAKQKDELIDLLWDAANQVAAKAGGQKLTEEMLRSIIAYEKKEFTLAAGEDPAKPQIKSVVIDEYKDDDNDRKRKQTSRSVTLKF